MNNYEQPRYTGTIHNNLGIIPRATRISRADYEAQVKAEAYAKDRARALQFDINYYRDERIVWLEQRVQQVLDAAQDHRAKPFEQRIDEVCAQMEADIANFQLPPIPRESQPLPEQTFELVVSGDAKAVKTWLKENTDYLKVVIVRDVVNSFTIQKPAVRGKGWKKKVIMKNYPWPHTVNVYLSANGKIIKFVTGGITSRIALEAAQTKSEIEKNLGKHRSRTGKTYGTFTLALFE